MYKDFIQKFHNVSLKVINVNENIIIVIGYFCCSNLEINSSIYTSIYKIYIKEP